VVNEIDRKKHLGKKGIGTREGDLEECRKKPINVRLAGKERKVARKERMVDP